MKLLVNNNNNEYKMEITLPNKRVILVNDESKERFMDKVVHCDSGCWVWAAARTRGSYGNFSVKVKTNGVFRYKMLRAHIYSCAVFNGVPESVLNTDENIVVMHTCDVPYCVSPHHLKFATAQENIARKLDIHFANVCRVLKGQTWSWVGKGDEF